MNVMLTFHDDYDNTQNACFTVGIGWNVSAKTEAKLQIKSINEMLL